MNLDLPRTPIAERTGTYGLGYGWSDDVYNTLTGGDLGQVLWRRTGGSTDRALHYDHIGNVVAESNTSGAIVATHEQDAYGRAVLGSYAGGWADNSLHQTAKPWDDATDLHYFNARWYDGAVGRFTSDAPMSRSLEHQYSLGENSPLHFYDSTGKVVVIVDCPEMRRRCKQWRDQRLDQDWEPLWQAYDQAHQGWVNCVNSNGYAGCIHLEGPRLAAYNAQQAMRESIQAEYVECVRQVDDFCRPTRHSDGRSSIDLGFIEVIVLDNTELDPLEPLPQPPPVPWPSPPLASPAPPRFII